VRLLIRDRLVYIRRERGDPQEVVYKNLDSSIFYGEVIFDTSESAVPKRMGLDSSIFYGTILLDTSESLVPKRKNLDSSIFYGDVNFDTSESSTPFRKMLKEATFSQSILAVNEPSLKVFVPVEIESSLSSTAIVEVDLEIAQDLEVVYDCGVWMGVDLSKLKNYLDISSNMLAESKVQSAIFFPKDIVVSVSSAFDSQSTLKSTSLIESGIASQSNLVILLSSIQPLEPPATAEALATEEDELLLTEDGNDIFTDGIGLDPETNIEVSLISEMVVEAIIFRPAEISSSLYSEGLSEVYLQNILTFTSELVSQSNVSISLQTAQPPVEPVDGDALLTEENEEILTEDGEEIHLDSIIEYLSGQILLTENGEIILTENGEIIITE
jgi:hypothetical protein